METPAFTHGEEMPPPSVVWVRTQEAIQLMIDDAQKAKWYPISSWALSAYGTPMYNEASRRDGQFPK
jgi:hypothetical protein